MPNDESLFIDQYEVLVGHWPERHDEAVLVVSSTNRITDFALFSIGIRDRNEMRAMLDSVMGRTEIEVEISESEGDFTFERLMNVSFRVVNPAEVFRYDETFSVWVDRSGDSAFMEELVEQSMELNIVGIVRPKQDATLTVLSMGVNYSPDLIYYLMAQAGETPIVQYQLANPYVNVLTGNTFAYEAESPETEFDFSRIITVDEDVFREAMGFDDALSAFDFGDLELDFSDIDMGDLDLSGLDLSELDFGDFDMGDLDMGDMFGDGFDMGGMFAGGAGGMGDFDMGDSMLDFINFDDILAEIAELVAPPQIDISVVMGELMEDFMTSDFVPMPPFNPILSPEENLNILMSTFGAYLAQPEIQARIMAEIGINPQELIAQITAIIERSIAETMRIYMQMIISMIMFNLYFAMSDIMQEVQTQIEYVIQTAMAGVMENMTAAIGSEMQSAMGGIMTQIEENITEAFEEFAGQMETSMEDFDPEALSDAFQIEIGEEEIFDLMMAMMNPRTTSFEQNLSRLGWADPNVPTQILIYPISFDAKQEVLDILDNYNSRMEALGYYELIVHFTDFVGMMMATVTDIIDMVSYALVAFVSVALIVSSIMIGVITFISVLERKKEIGILRAVGASKGNIRLVFNAETLIIGFVAGVIGVLATLLIAVVANIIILNNLGIDNLVIMPVGIPIVLVAISMFLTYIAGLIPASAAAAKAPVEALRSE